MSGAPALWTRAGTLGQSPHPQRVKVVLAHKICMVFLRAAVTPARGHPAVIITFPFSQRRKEAQQGAGMALGSHSKSGQNLLASAEGLYLG